MINGRIMYKEAIWRMSQWVRTYILIHYFLSVNRMEHFGLQMISGD